VSLSTIQNFQYCTSAQLYICPRKK